MKVAWHAVPGKHAFAVPSRRERYDWWVRGRGSLLDTALPDRQSGVTPQTVPYGTDSRSRPSQALRAGLPSLSPFGTKELN
jgi:hypothetical protein